MSDEASWSTHLVVCVFLGIDKAGSEEKGSDTRPLATDTKGRECDSKRREDLMNAWCYAL